MAELDPDKREWEYDGTGAKIYKLKAGYPTKTPYTDLDGGVPMKKEPYNFGAFSTHARIDQDLRHRLFGRWIFLFFPGRTHRADEIRRMKV